MLPPSIPAADCVRLCVRARPAAGYVPFAGTRLGVDLVVALRYLPHPRHTTPWHYRLS